MLVYEVIHLPRREKSDMNGTAAKKPSVLVAVIDWLPVTIGTVAVVCAIGFLFQLHNGG